MRKIISRLLLVMLCLVSLGLFGCNQNKNPLITDSYIKRMVALSHSMFGDEVILCGKYYAGVDKTDVKAKCDKWTKETFETDSKSGFIPATAKLEDFRDPDFWQAVLAK